MTRTDVSMATSEAPARSATGASLNQRLRLDDFQRAICSRHEWDPYGNGLDSHAPRGPDDAASDLPAIGDQNLPEHSSVSPESFTVRSSDPPLRGKLQMATRS